MGSKRNDPQFENKYFTDKHVDRPGSSKINAENERGRRGPSNPQKGLQPLSGAGNNYLQNNGQNMILNKYMQANN
jgi:hypothetical protein